MKPGKLAKLAFYANGYHELSLDEYVEGIGRGGRVTGVILAGPVKVQKHKETKIQTVWLVLIKNHILWINELYFSSVEITH